MTCTNCGAENRAGAKFCSECGTAQALACSNCQAALEATAKFCSECGTPTARAAAPTPAVDSAPADKPEERRIVSAVFIDLVGFTPLTESMDSEEVRRMLTVYFDRAREIVEHFGGVIDKYIGDAVMAVWGAHTAHEDDAERAVRAALEMVDAVYGVGEELNLPNLRARAGVLSGEATVGGDGNAVTGLIIGDTVNTASRLQSAAAPGQVLVGRSTRDLTAKAIEFEPIGDLDLKGKEGPVEAFRAVRIVSGRGGSRRSDGLVPPFVGRADELRVLKDNLHSAQRDGRLRLVSIVGQGGIGKSRLVDELWSYVDGLNDTVYWHHGRSLPYGENAGFWAIGEMVRQRCGITEGESEHETRTRLRTALAELVDDSDDREWMEPKLEKLLGISEALSERAELFAAWRMFFTAVARRGPVVMVFEDLHHADDGMLDFIEDFVELAKDTPVAVVTLARPDLLDRRVGWGSGRANNVSLHLAPLAPSTMGSLITGVVIDAPDDLVGRLVERAGGVPLYAVETVRMLIDRNLVRAASDGQYEMAGQVEDVDIPNSLHGLVGARLDQFDADARSLIADAAILGQSFRPEALGRIRSEDVESLGRRLDELVDKEILSLNRDPRSPERGQYQFVQAIIREVAHERVSRADRLRLHQEVAAFYESREEPELAGIAASHYLDALEAAADGPDADFLRPKVIESLHAAADRADLLGSFAQVVSLCLRGVDLSSDPSERSRLLARAARAAHSALDDRARELARRALEESKESGDPVAAVRAAEVYGKLWDDVGDSHEAWPVLLQTLEAHPGDTPEHVTAMAELARSLMLDNQPSAMEWAERGLALAEALEMLPTIAELWATKGAGLGNAGRMREGGVLLNAALGLARDNQLLATKRRAMANINYLDGGQFDPFVEERIDDARRLGDNRLLAEALMTLAGRWYMSLDMGEYEEAIAELEALALDEGTRDALEEIRSHLTMLRGEVAEGITAAEERWARQGPGDSQTEANRQLDRAQHLWYSGQPVEAFEVAISSDHRSPLGHQYNWALVMALKARRADLIERVAEATRDLPQLPVADLRDETIAGALAALEGDLVEAEARFAAAIEIGDELWGPLYGGALRVLTVLYLGPGNPQARAWAELARDRWLEAGLSTVLEIHAEEFAALDTVAETA